MHIIERHNLASTVEEFSFTKQHGPLDFHVEVHQDHLICLLKIFLLRDERCNWGISTASFHLSYGFMLYCYSILLFQSQDGLWNWMNIWNCNVANLLLEYFTCFSCNFQSCMNSWSTSNFFIPSSNTGFELIKNWIRRGQLKESSGMY